MTLEEDAKDKTSLILAGASTGTQSGSKHSYLKINVE